MRKPKYDEKILHLIANNRMTAAEIRDAIGLPSNGIIYQILNRLVNKGQITKHSDNTYEAERGGKYKPKRMKEGINYVVDEIEAPNVDLKSLYEDLGITKPKTALFPSSVLWEEIKEIDEKIENLMVVKLYLVQRAQWLEKDGLNELPS